ncbi:chromatin modification- protein VID21, partial [Nowakowskiella sp. JEL0078]
MIPLASVSPSENDKKKFMAFAKQYDLSNLNSENESEKTFDGEPVNLASSSVLSIQKRNGIAIGRSRSQSKISDSGSDSELEDRIDSDEDFSKDEQYNSLIKMKSENCENTKRIKPELGKVDALVENQIDEDERDSKRRRIISEVDNTTVGGISRTKSGENSPDSSQAITNDNQQAYAVLKARKDNSSELKRYQLYSWRLNVQQFPLSNLLINANKVVTGKDWQLAREEAKQLKVLNRVEQLKEEGRWSFKQLKKVEPILREKTHWDFLMEEM